MKKSIVCLALISLGFIGVANAQNKRDVAFIEMAERMTFYDWTFNQPPPKKILWWRVRHPHNLFLYQLYGPGRRYRKGRDLRPLKSWGEQTLRQLELSIQGNETEQIKESLSNLATTTAKELAHWSNKVVNLDPLWNIYYKDKLKNLMNFSEEPGNYNDWGFKNEAIYSKLKDVGILDSLQEELELIKDKFKVSRKTDMPRGKRLIMYNEIINEWEEFASKAKDCEDIGQALIHLDEANKYKLNIKPSRTDKEIIDNVMDKYKTLF